MSVKVVKGLISPSSGYREVKTGATSSASSPNQTASANSLQQGVALSTQAVRSRSLSDAVVSSVKGGRGAGSTDKIREFQEAKEVSQDVAEKIRDDQQDGDSHHELQSFSGRAHLNN